MDSAQVTAVLSFSDAWQANTEASDAWVALVQIASCTNVAKWTSVKIGVSALLASFAAILSYEASRLASKDT